MVKLFIVGIPRDMGETELKEIFTKYGEVVSVKIITEQYTGKSRGYAFLIMKDQDGALRAIELMDGAEIDDRRISVRVAAEKQAISQKTHSRPGLTVSPLSNRQYVEKLTETPKKKRPRIRR
jgi:RNA recognition motif-containing protein